MSKIKQYDEQSIQILEGLEAVRKRPGMYVGSTDSRGLHHLVFEIVDNAIDEALIGYANEISVTIHNDNSVSVLDNGRGMPYKTHASGIPTTQVIFTTLHAGGKFSESSGYKVAGGLHGVGSAVVNALSSYLEVSVFRDNHIFMQRFENGGKDVFPQENIGETRKTGTLVKFKPDHKIFSTTLFQYEIIRDRLKESAFLIKKLKINLIDERNKQKDSFYYEKGIVEFIEFLNKDKKSFHEPIEINSEYITNNAKKEIIEVDLAIQFTSSYQEVITSFVNNVKTKDGGTHEMGFKIGLTKAINEYARKYNLIKERESNLDGVDIREGLTAIVSLRIPESILEFEGQTKGKLGTPDARIAVDNILQNYFQTYLEENRQTAESIVLRAIQARRVREAARKAREELRSGKKRASKEVSLTGKLTPAQSKNKMANELFLVEGDSAGGSAKQGRNRLYQAILPLRGKVINSEKASADDVLKNEEINTIIHTIGADYGLDFNIKKANYGKVIIMTDADYDGAHIQVLLLTFFFRFMRPLIEEGRLFIAQPPLYKLSRKKGSKEEVLYAWSDDELKTYLDEAQYQIQRYKGLGEMNASQLWETTMNPESRTLIKVNIDDLSQSDKHVSILMGTDVKPRREWIDENVDFETVDDFKIEKGA